MHGFFRPTQANRISALDQTKCAYSYSPNVKAYRSITGTGRPTTNLEVTFIESQITPPGHTNRCTVINAWAEWDHMTVCDMDEYMGHVRQPTYIEGHATSKWRHWTQQHSWNYMTTYKRDNMPENPPNHPETLKLYGGAFCPSTSRAARFCPSKIRGLGGLPRPRHRAALVCRRTLGASAGLPESENARYGGGQSL